MSQDKLLISKRKCHFYWLLELTGHNDSITAVIPCEALPAISNYKTLAAQHIMWLLLFVQINIKPLDATGISHQPLNVFFSGRHIIVTHDLGGWAFDVRWISKVAFVVYAS